eukprot:SAG11_NODE_21_length_25065_cov_3.589081_2_plen_215_part_00
MHHRCSMNQDPMANRSFQSRTSNELSSPHAELSTALLSENSDVIKRAIINEMLADATDAEVACRVLVDDWILKDDIFGVRARPLKQDICSFLFQIQANYMRTDKAQSTRLHILDQCFRLHHSQPSAESFRPFIQAQVHACMYYASLCQSISASVRETNRTALKWHPTTNQLILGASSLLGATRPQRTNWMKTCSNAGVLQSATAADCADAGEGG